MFAFDDCVTSANTDVINSYLTLVSSTKFELRLFWSHRQQMNVSRSIFVKRHRLKKNVVVVNIHLLGEIYYLVYVSTNLEGVWVHLFTNFTFETLPVERAYVLVLSIWWFLLFLCKHPILQALEMNKTYSTFAFTGNNQGIVGIFLAAPTNSALNLVFGSISSKIFNSFNFLGFFKFLVIKFTFTHWDLITLEVFNSKSNSSKLDCIKFLNLVIVFSSLIFERTSYEPKAINTFLLLIDGWGCMV